jgi:hypothetical protein
MADRPRALPPALLTAVPARAQARRVNRRRVLLLCAALLSGVLACKSNASPPAPAAPGDSASAGVYAQAAPAPTLGKGDPAPAFSLQGSDGKTHALADSAGKQAVVIAWFPKAFTGG